jgi:hypothetical protein
MPRKTITIYDSDDFERLGELRTEVSIAEREALSAKTPARFGDDIPDAVRLAKDAYDAFVDEAAARADAWELHSIGHEAWRDLVAAHPPRKVKTEDDPPKEVDHPEDAPFGVDTETFGKALLTFVDPDDDEHRTIAKIGDMVPTDLAKRLRRLSVGQFDTLWVTAFYLNTGGVADPKATRYSTGPRSDDS